MSWKILRPQIAQLVTDNSTLVDDSNVSTAPKLKFDGYPAIHIVPSDNSGDYETTAENIRTYAFRLRIFHEVQSTEMEAAIATVEEVVDELLDLFDEEGLKQGNDRTIGVSLPGTYTMINLFATPSSFGELAEQQLVYSEMIIKVRISIDIT